MPTYGLFGAARRAAANIPYTPAAPQDEPLQPRRRSVLSAMAPIMDDMAVRPDPVAPVVEAKVPPRGMFGGSAPKPKYQSNFLLDAFGYNPDTSGMGGMQWWFSSPTERAAAAKSQAAAAEQARFDAMVNSMGLDPRERLALELNPGEYGKSLAGSIADSRKPQTQTFYDPKSGQWVRKPLDPMAVAEGTDIYDPEQNRSIYTNAPTPKPPEPFTLNPGDVRFDGSGKRIASVAPNPQQSTAQTWRAATDADVQTYGLPDRNYLISSTGDVKQITDSRKTGQVPASVQSMEQKYLDNTDADASRLLDLSNKYNRFNTLAKDWNSQGEGIFNDIGQALSMDTSTLKSITSELIGKMRQPGEGVMTDADAKRLENATVSINQTREGNQLAERVITAGAKRAQERALFLRQWVADNGAGSLNKGKLAWNYYMQKFPVYNPQTGEPNEGAPDAYGWVGQQGFAAQDANPRIPSGAMSGGQPVRVTSKEQMDALPPGTPFIAPDGSTWTKK